MLFVGWGDQENGKRSWNSVTDHDCSTGMLSLIFWLRIVTCSIIKDVGVLKLPRVRWKVSEFCHLDGSVLSNLFFSLLFQKLAEDRSLNKNVRKSRKLTYQKSLSRVRIVFCVNGYIFKRLYRLILLCFGQKLNKYLTKCLCLNMELLLEHS